MPTFSHSRIESYQQCPKAYNFKYLQDEKERFSTVEQQMGSAVHAALEWAYENREVKTPGVSSVLDRYRKAFSEGARAEVRVIKRGCSKGDYLQEGESMLKVYLRDRFADDDSETLALEREFSIQLGDGISFRGFVDRVARDSDGTLVLLDYKTGKRVPDPADNRQLLSYALWAFEEWQEESIRLVFEDLRGERRLTGQVHRSEIPRITSDLAAEVQRVIHADRFPASASHLCRWCGYCPICPDAHASVPRSWREVSESKEDEDGESCPRCGGFLEERSGRKGRFIGCSEFPSCRYTRDDW